MKYRNLRVDSPADARRRSAIYQELWCGDFEQAKDVRELVLRWE